MSFYEGTVPSWRLQSASLGERRVSCIMHGSCYFHHMVLSGVIVLPAPSAQIAVMFTDCCFGVYFNRLPPLTLPVISFSVLYFTASWKWRSRTQWLPLTGPCLRSGVEPGFSGALSRAACCHKAGPRCQATQENAREKVALLWSPCIISHSK